MSYCAIDTLLLQLADDEDNDLPESPLQARMIRQSQVHNTEGNLRPRGATEDKSDTRIDIQSIVQHDEDMVEIASTDSESSPEVQKPKR